MACNMETQISDRCYAEQCEHCGRHVPLYRIILPDPSCSDWLVCEMCREQVLDNLEAVWGE